MGFLNFFAKPSQPVAFPKRVGSYSVDHEGNVLVSTVTIAFPEAQMQEIGLAVLNAFRQAREAQLPLKELIFDFAEMRIVAREVRNGAIIFLLPTHPEIPRLNPL